MRQHGEMSSFGGFPRPGPALKGVLVVIFTLWLLFAVAINWGPDAVAGAAGALFFELVGNTEAVFVGQLWRLLTAALLHSPDGLGHILFMLLGLYFLSPSLESAWGSDRYLKFLVASALIAYGLQAAVLFVVPDFAVRRLAPTHWLGALPVVEAIAIAWALSFKGRKVHLFMVLPVTSTQLIWFVVIGSVLAIVALSGSHSGLVSPFGGMLAGWLLSGNPSTLRRLYLKLKLRQHERELARVSQRRSQRVASSGLRVIEGGRGSADDSDDEDDSGPNSGPGTGRMLH